MISLSNSKLAEAATVTIHTGTVCPCKAVSQDGLTYDAQWHRDNPAPGDEECSGSLLIATTATATNIKAVFYPIGMGGSVLPKNLESLAPIGKIQKDDLFMIGTLNTDTNTFKDLSAINEAIDYITYRSNKYAPRDGQWIPGSVGQTFHLVRRN